APDGFDQLTKAGFADLNRFQGLTVSLSPPWVTGTSTSGPDIGNRGPSLRGNPDWSVGGNLTWLKGNHNLKAGGAFTSVERQQINTFQSFGFSAAQTNNPASSGNTGLSLASALLGLPQGYSGELPDIGEVNFRASGWDAFVQDEWRVSPQLTLNWGV